MGFQPVRPAAFQAAAVSVLGALIEDLCSHAPRNISAFDMNPTEA
jgi:hypothetical protein